MKVLAGLVPSGGSEGETVHVSELLALPAVRAVPGFGAALLQSLPLFSRDLLCVCIQMSLFKGHQPLD